MAPNCDVSDQRSDTDQCSIIYRGTINYEWNFIFYAQLIRKPVKPILRASHMWPLSQMDNSRSYVLDRFIDNLSMTVSISLCVDKNLTEEAHFSKG